MTGSETNAAQVELWNGEEAQHWVVEQDRYDRMLAPFATAVLELAALSPTDRVVDIGCGTGPTTCDAARTVSGGHARGLDISQPMIDGARERAAALGLSNVTFDVGDAQTDRLTPDVDVVLSRFGVMFFDDADAAFANLRTALGAEGRLAFVCWQGMFLNEWMAVPALAAVQHVPLPEMGPPDAPGPFSLGDPDRVRSVLSGAGYSDITVDPFETTLLLGGGGSLDEAVTFLRSTGMAHALFDGAPADDVDRAIAAVRTALEPHVTPEGVRLGAATWLVAANR
jgi:SAM-dependent methyltransferase